MSQPYTGQLLKWISTVRLLGINGRQRRRDLITHHMVIGDNNIQAQAVAKGHFLNRSNTAIYGEDNFNPPLIKLLQGFHIQAVTLFEAIGDVGLSPAAQGGEQLHHECRCRNTIRIIVPVNGDGLSLQDSRGQSFDSLGHPFQSQRIIISPAMVKKVTDIPRRCNSSIKENLNH